MPWIRRRPPRCYGKDRSPLGLHFFTSSSRLTSLCSPPSRSSHSVQLLEKRPLSPDVLDIDGSTHYKFPIVALSSITNRVTGCVLSGAVAFGGTLSAVGGPEALPYFIEGFKSTVPFLVFPTKALIGFPFVYHTLGGFRHMVWDKTTNGIDNASARASSIGLFAASGAVTAALASMSF